MTSKSNLIPSKNALRALRNLAYAHPILFSGALGSACCAAAASCEVQRKIRVAEKVVATKRTLQSVSNGKRSNRVARMIEAAEKGESFLLDPRSGQRRQRPRPRSYSTALAEKEHEDHDRTVSSSEAQATGPLRDGVMFGPSNTNAEAFSQATYDAPAKSATYGVPPIPEESIHRYTGPRQRAEGQDPCFYRPERAKNGERKPQSSASPLVPAASHAWAIDSQRPRNSASAEKVKAASMMSMKSDGYHAYGRTRAKGIDSAYEDSGDAATMIQPEDRVEALPGVELDASKPAMNTDERLPLDAGDNLADISEQNTSVADACETSIGAGSEHEKLTESYDELEDAISISPFEWQSPESDFVDIKPEEGIVPGFVAALSDDMGVELQTHGYFTHLYSGATTPPQWTQRSNSREKAVGVGHWSMAGQQIRELVEKGSLRPAAVLYHEHYEPLRDGLLPSTAKLLLPKLLWDNSTHHLAIQILLSDKHPVAGRGGAEERQWRRTRLYMREFCGLTSDPEQWKAQAEKILVGARDDGHSLHGKALESVVVALCASGRTQDAELWVKTMVAKYSLTRDIDLDKHITLGYARSNDWSSVNRIMQALQEEEIPRTRPYWYSYLFEQVLNRHLRRNTLENTYDYLINAMGYWKLAPTRNISCALIAACIEAGDYLHLQQWIEAVRAMWPRLDVGTASRSLAEAISRIWDEKRVTCEHIEQACSAMAFGAISDPFSPYLRAIMMESIKADLRRQISSYETLSGTTTMLKTDARETFTALVHRAQSCTENQSLSAKSDPELQFARHRLLCQLKAIWRLFQVVAGKTSHEQSSSDPASDNDGLLLLEPVDKVDRGVIPAPLRTTDLPHAQQLWPQIGKHYLDMRRQRRPVDHTALEHVVETLRDHGRLREAATLLDSICGSPFVIGPNGKFLPTRLYETYLSIVSHMGEAKHCQRAMWAVLDASREILITPTMLLRAVICVSGAQKQMDFRRFQEIRYLHTRMRKTRYIQMGRPARPDLLPEWKTWDERVRKVRRHLS